MESAIETSGKISAEYLCKLWATRPAMEMADMIHGFYMLDISHDWDMRDEVRFLQELCWEKHSIERGEHLMRAAA